MNKYSLKKPFVISSITVFLTISISISIIPSSLSYAYMEYDVARTDSSEDRSITSSQSSNQGSYCYAPPNATIINSCNSRDLSSSENTGMNYYEQ